MSFQPEDTMLSQFKLDERCTVSLMEKHSMAFLRLSIYPDLSI